MNSTIAGTDSWVEPLCRLRRAAIDLAHHHVAVQVHVDAQLDNPVRSRALCRATSGGLVAHHRIHRLFGLLVGLGQQLFDLLRLEFCPELGGVQRLCRARRPALALDSYDIR